MSKFINALGFLTIIKIPKKYILKREQVADSTVYFPIAGLVIGIILSLFYFVASFIFPVFLSVILLIGLEVFLSGGAHLDGLSDMFDGTFSGRSDKNKILEIMKKSDTGVYGILSIVFLLLLKISIVYYLASINSGHVLIFYLTIIFMPAFGRWSMVFLIGRYKNARGIGSGSSSGGNSTSTSSLAKIFTDSKNKRKNFYISSIYLFLLFLVLYTFFGYIVYLTGGGVGVLSFLNNLESVYLILFILVKALLVTAALFLLLLPVSWFFTRRIGGITGDIIGGVSEITELLFLFASYLVFTFFI